MKILSNHVLRDHVFIGAAAALMLLPWLGIWGGFIFWAASVLIDLDHLFRFLYLTRFRILGVRPMFRFFEDVFAQRHHPEFLSVEVFHTIEFLVLFGVISVWFAPVLLPAFWGFVFHMFVDLIHLARFRMLTKRSHSFAEYAWRRRKMKLMGKNPDYVFHTSLKSLERSV